MSNTMMRSVVLSMLRLLYFPLKQQALASLSSSENRHL
jgi:hypothetical protein